MRPPVVEPDLDGVAVLGVVDQRGVVDGHAARAAIPVRVDAEGLVAERRDVVQNKFRRVLAQLEAQAVATPRALDLVLPFRTEEAVVE